MKTTQALAAPRRLLLLVKSHVSAYTKKDGTFVPEHEDGRQAHKESKPTLDDIVSDWKGEGISASVHEKNGVITLSKIIVPQSERGSGKGTEAMRSLVAYADKAGHRIELSPSADFGGKKNRLIEFYKRFGFIENKGKNKDYSTMESMYREPKREVMAKSEGVFKHSGKYYLKDGRWHSIKHDKPAPKGAPIAAHPIAGGQHAPISHFTDEQWAKLKLPDSNSNAGTFNKQLDKLKEHSDAGNVTAILGSGIGTNTYGQKIAKVSNHLLSLHGSPHTVTPGQKAGEHDAVKAAPAETAAPEPVTAKKPAPEPVAGAPKPDDKPSTIFPMPDFTEGKTVSGVVDYYEVVAGKIMAMAEAGDLSGLHAMKADGMKPNAKGKVSNTWAGKTANSKALIALHNKALSHTAAKHVAEVLPEPEKPAEQAEAPDPKPAEKVIGKLITAEMGKQKAADKLSRIPWDGLKLPDTNSNAGTFNKKLSEIKAAAEAGDIEKLKGMKFGVNTYGKKAAKVAETAIAALSSGQTEQKKPAKPNLRHYAEETAHIEDKLSNNDIQGLDDYVEHLSKMGVPEEPDDKALVKYANDAVAYLKNRKNAAEKGKAKMAEQKATPAKPHLNNETYQAISQAIDSALANGDIETLKNYVEKTEGSQSPDGLKLEAYAKAALAHAEGGQGGSPKEGDTKEGDTKEGADGTLVFKNGRWHKQKAAEPDAAGDHPIDSIPAPDLSGWKPLGQEKITAALAKLKEQIKAGDLSGLKGITKQMASGKIIMNLPHPSYPDGYKMKISGFSAMQPVKEYVDAIKAAAGKPAKAAKKPKAEPTPIAGSGSMPAIDNWQQTGPQGGSNPGGRYKDENGVEWYCKFPANEDIAKSEVLAAKLYAAAGIAGQDAKLITKDGKVGIASRWTDVSKADSPSKLAKVAGVREGFAVDAWLGNWDVVGLEYDNLQVGADGKAIRIDAGGSLEYRAQGGKKAFGNSVVELDSLRDKSINPQAAAIFGKMTKADVTASAAKVANLSDDSIRILVNKFGPGDEQAKIALANTLIARKADIIAKFPKAKKEKVITFKPEKISAPPSFTNWGGSGSSGPSSKEFLNQANEKAVQAIYAAAKTGKVEAIQQLTAETFNKETGNVVGNAKVLEHPSQHVKGYAQQAINEINYQYNPPKRFRFDGGHPLNSLNQSYPSHKGPLHSSAVNKLAKFVLLGEPGTISLEALALPKQTYAAGQVTQQTYKAAAQAATSQMPATQLQAIQSYTGNGYTKMNHSLWDGNPTGAAKSAAEAIHTLGHEIAPGTVLSRKISISGSDLDQLLKSAGKVLQEPAIMSTSIRPSSWSGNVQLKMHVGPGVKGLWVGMGSKSNGGAISSHSGEDEMILPPNTRMLVLSTSHSKGADSDGFGAASQHIIEVVILPTQDHHD